MVSWKGLVYPLLPSWSHSLHGKRRKGLGYRHVPRNVLECQMEQDRLFWALFLHPGQGGIFLEAGGDGSTGSHTLGLEREHGWEGVVHVQGERAQARAKQVRRCRVAGAGLPLAGSPAADVLALHAPQDFPEIRQALAEKKIRPRWVIVENREPDPQWCRRLESLGYKLKFYFHDDEYYELQN